jgi:hypothetical protein
LKLPAAIFGFTLAVHTSLLVSQGEIITGLDYLFTGAFTAEMLLKMKGLSIRGYFNDGNKSDFSIVVLSDLGLVIELVTKTLNSSSTSANELSIVRTVRVFRVLRPLLVVSHFEGMQLILYSIAKSAVAIVNVIFLLLFVWTIVSTHLLAYQPSVRARECSPMLTLQHMLRFLAHRSLLLR